MMVQSFTYDALDRLLSAAASGGTGGTYSESYSYLANGRMSNGPLSSTSTCSYSDGTHKHAVTSAGTGNSFAYAPRGHPNGNMTAP